MKCYEVTLYDKEKNFSFSYMEFAKTAKEAKDKAKPKTNHRVISAKVVR